MNAAPPFRELRPLLGSKIAALERAHLLGDTDDRHEIEVVLELLRRQATTDRSILLQPPERDEADGPIRLGRIRHGRSVLGWTGITERELTQHMAVTGRSGSGKSTLCLHILLQLIQRSIPWLVFDYKRSTRALRGRPDGQGVHVVCLGRDVGATLAFNIMEPPPGVPVDTHQRQLSELISTCWFAGDGVISLLERAMTQCYAAAAPAYPTIADVRAAIDELPAKSREMLWKTSAQRILSQMTTGQLGRIFNTRSDASGVAKLLRNHTVIELDGLATADANFITQFLMRWMTQALLTGSTRENLRLVCLVEEAHHLLAKHEGSRETVLETCLREGREIGLGIILADQSISAISPTALANCFTTVCMNVRQRADVTAAAGSLLLDDTQREMLGTLPVGEAVLRLSDRWPWPIHVAVPALSLPKGQITDADLRLAYLNGPYAVSTQGDSSDSPDSAANSTHQRQPLAISAVPRADMNTPSSDSNHPEADQRVPYQSQVPGDRREDAVAGDPISESGDLRLLLEHVARFPLVGVARRFDELGFSRRKGDAIKRALIELDYLAPVDVAIPAGKTVLLALTAGARRWLDRHRVPITPTNGGLQHAYWQDRAAAILADAGWNVTTEHVVRGHAVDVHATKDGESMAIEIETGASDWQDNLERLRHAPVTHRAVLWLDPALLLKVKALVDAELSLLQPAQLERWIRER